MSELCILILTHGRPDRCMTEKHLRRCGYTGPVFYVIDDEDATGDQYRQRFGADRVIEFSKSEVAETFDEADNFEDRRAIVYARNASFSIAEKLGFRYFVQMDDDYHEFKYSFDGDRNAKISEVRSLDRVFSIMLDFFKATPLQTLAMSQGGDIQGGAACTDLKVVKTKRKAMNSFLCDVERPFTFTGRINEDVNTYVSQGHKGSLFLQIYGVFLTQVTTQQGKGGMSDIYAAAGTFVKSFYTVLFAPSCVKVTAMGYSNPRLHHLVKWRNAVPMIISPDLRKKR